MVTTRSPVAPRPTVGQVRPVDQVGVRAAAVLTAAPAGAAETSVAVVATGTRPSTPADSRRMNDRMRPPSGRPHAPQRVLWSPREFRRSGVGPPRSAHYGMTLNTAQT